MSFHIIWIFFILMTIFFFYFQKFSLVLFHCYLLFHFFFFCLLQKFSYLRKMDTMPFFIPIRPWNINFFRLVHKIHIIGLSSCSNFWIRLLSLSAVHFFNLLWNSCLHTHFEHTFKLLFALFSLCFFSLSLSFSLFHLSLSLFFSKFPTDLGFRRVFGPPTPWW